MRLGLLAEMIVPVLLLGWLGLMIMGAVNSQTGYGALAERKAERDEIAREVARLRARRMHLSARADLLNSQGLDADMLEERVRDVLGFARDGEIAIDRKALRRVALARQTGLRRERTARPANKPKLNAAPQKPQNLAPVQVAETEKTDREGLSVLLASLVPAE